VQTTTSPGGGWDLNGNPGWYARVDPAQTYTASIWVRATRAVKVRIGLDLLRSNGTPSGTSTGRWVTISPGAWTKLVVSGIKPTGTEVYAGMAPMFAAAAKGTVIYWGDMDLTLSDAK